jgi:hypothetical protein
MRFSLIRGHQGRWTISSFDPHLPTVCWLQRSGLCPSPQFDTRRDALIALATAIQIKEPPSRKEWPSTVIETMELMVSGARMLERYLEEKCRELEARS